MPLRQRQRDILKLLTPVLQGQRTQAEAARWRDITPRHTRRLLRPIQAGGHAARRRGRRGRPPNRPSPEGLRHRVLEQYHPPVHDFGPIRARDNGAERGLHVGLETLRRGRRADGLGQPRQPLGRGPNLAAMVRVQHQRGVTKDSTVRFANRIEQVGKPIEPGLRGGRVGIE
jgi:hypothetical protein